MALLPRVTFRKMLPVVLSMGLFIGLPHASLDELFGEIALSESLATVSAYVIEVNVVGGGHGNPLTVYHEQRRGVASSLTRDYIRWKWRAKYLLSFKLEKRGIYYRLLTILRV
ncbi:hypothetical protein JHK84_028939 [Glycine max]|nr:hypothetical protein JHK84_028939 [Glycine max]